jgi:hypothetical protein
MVCDRIDKEHITSSVWKKCFPANYTETEYTKHNFCTFNIIIDLIERKTNERLTINEIKNQLYDEYKQYLEKYKDKIVDILISEGKKTLGDQVHADTLSFANFIYTDNYFLTTLDLWLLVNRFKIPTIFIAQKTILQTRYEKNGKYLYKRQFIAYGDKGENFAFIVLPGFRPENIPSFKIINNDKKDVFISLDKLNEECLENIEDAFENKISIEKYLEDFKILPKTSYQKKRINVLIESDSEEKIVKPRRKQVIVEKTTPISPEKPVSNEKKPSRKAIIKGDTKNKSRRRRDITKRKVAILESSPTEPV